MAKRYEPVRIGIDVSKATLAICQAPGEVIEVANTAAGIDGWLRQLAGPADIAIEATGTYHRTVLARAHAAGHRLYVVDGLRLVRYRDSIGGRAKTDPADARLLRRYLLREIDQLRPWTPPPAGYTRLQALLQRRARLVQTRTTLSQSLAEVPELRAEAADLLARLARLIAVLESHLRQLARQSQVHRHVQRLLPVEGLGPITSLGLANAYQRGQFRSSDAFIAFLGLDVCVRDSGRFRGRRTLTKRGDPELRRLLYNAAMAAVRKGRWQGLYAAYQARGLSKTQSLVIIARKLARLAFSLLRHQSDYQPDRTCMAT